MLRNRIIKKLRLPDRGVDLWSTPITLSEGEASVTKNCFWRNGILTRLGSAKHSANEVVASKPILGLHRFYYDTTGKVLLAACDTVVAKMNDSTGAWTNIKTGLTTGKQTHFVTWGALNRCYVSNGTDAPFRVNNSEVEETGSALGAPTDTVMFLPYRDRLLSIEGTAADANAGPSFIRWSGSYDDTSWTSTAQAIRVPGPGPIQALINHSLTESQEGVNTMVLVAKPSNLHIFSGTDLDPTSITFNARLDPVGGGDSVGCVSPRTMVSTPKGTIFLGSDSQVYILQYGSVNLVPIGHKIQAFNNDEHSGITDIPSGQRANATAVYHDGFYKLSFAISGGTTNTHQYWLDVDRLSANEQGQFGPWYGPMIGMAIGPFVALIGSDDTGKLLGGHSGLNGFVYECQKSGTYSDTQHGNDGTAQAGGATTITLAAAASSTDDAYNGYTIETTGGTGSGQTAIISDYDGTTKVATVPTWGTNPDATTTYEINNLQAISMLYRSNHDGIDGLDIRIFQTEIEMSAPDGTVVLGFNDTTGGLSTSTSLSPEGSGNYYGDADYDVDYYDGSGGAARRKIQHYDKYYTGRYISTALSYSSSTDQLDIRAVTHEAAPIRQTFQVRA